MTSREKEILSIIRHELKRQKESGHIHYEEALDSKGNFQYCALDGNINLFDLAKAIAKTEKE